MRKQKRLYENNVTLLQSNEGVVVKSEENEFITCSSMEDPDEIEEISEDFYNVKIEIEVQNSTPLSCNKCDFNSKSRKLLKQHENEMHQVLTLFCDRYKLLPPLQSPLDILHKIISELIFLDVNTQRALKAILKIILNLT